MSKAAEAFRTISEVAADLDVPKHVLRFWEAKFPQIRPMKRGGGRRYYRPEDLELLRGIRRLLHAEGYTIKGVQKILREQGIDQVKAFAHVTAAAEKPKGRGRAKSDGAAGIAVAGPIAAAPAAPAVARKSARGPEVKDIDSVIRGAIVELETCRRLLLGEAAGEVAASSPPVRVRAARG
jgi:DNA-binding transcriptional MerR regulator